MSRHAIRSLSSNAASTWIATLAALLFLALGLRALLSPTAAAASFGVPLTSGDCLAFVQAFGARNIGLSLVALAMIGLDERRGLAAVFCTAALIAALDFSIVTARAGALHAVKHLAYLVSLSGFGLWFATRR